MQPLPRFPLMTAAFVAALACLAPLQASAALGGDEASVEADRLAMGGTAGTPQPAAAYTAKKFTLPSGTVVREFLSTGGTVFAVAWEGPQIPDLKQLLGDARFAAMDDAARARNREGGRGPMALRPDAAPNLVIESGGHMRAFSGRAYLSDKLPSGVDADAIR